MPRYRVEIHGENFLIQFEDRLAKHGFITYRVVEAQDPEVAEEKAVKLVRKDDRLRKGMRNPASDPPRITATGVLPLKEAAPSADAPPPGFIWYKSSPKRRGQGAP